MKVFGYPHLFSTPMTVDDTFGALFIGNEISLVAFGFLLLQYWNFCHNWSQESFSLKLIVSLSLILGFLLIFLTSHTLYHYLISSIGKPKALTVIVWSFKAEPWASEVVVTLTHVFYAVRIFHMQRSYVLPGLLLLLTLIHTALVSAASGLKLSVEEFAPTKASTAGLINASLLVGLILDLIITLAMFHFLYVNRSEIKSTQSLLNKLTLYTFASGLLTVVSNAIIFALYLSKRNTQIYTGASFVLPHIYSNCLLAILNSRANLRARYNGTTDLAALPTERSASISGFNVSRQSRVMRFSHGEYSIEKAYEPLKFGRSEHRPDYI